MSSFEQSLQQLQAIVRKLESGELTLEDSLKSFEEGVKLSRLCQTTLSEAEKRVEILTKVQTDGTVETAPFQAKE